MTPETFLEEFSTVANAPDGVQRLREMILQLAVQGKLVPQNPENEPASYFFEDIDPKTSGKQKAKDRRDLVKVEEEYLTLPENWIWARLKWVGNLFNGNSINEKIKEEKYTGKKEIEGLPFIATKDVGYGFISLNYGNGIRIPVDEPRFKIAHKNSVLICAEGGSAGKKCGIADQNICFGNKLFAFESFGKVHQNFLLSLYLSPVFFRQFQGKMTGIIGGISLANFSNIPIPLPPLEEQHRIVAKVDQLMALCDQLEAQQRKRTKLIGHTRKTILEALADALSREELRAAWQRAEENLGMLFETPEDVEDLKKTILQNAVMGKLVEQNSEDEPASELLKKIAAEKAEMVKKKKIGKGKDVPRLSRIKEEFDIPISWNWICFGECWESSFYGPRFGKNEYVTTGGYPTIRTTDMTSAGKIQLQSPPKVFVPEDKLSIYKVNRGDLLITRSGSIGTMAIFESNEIAIPSAYLIRVRFTKHMNPYYAFYFLQSPSGQKQLGLNTNGVGVPNVNASNMWQFIFPLPPLAEQYRIVAKVQSLLALCDGLQSRIAESRTIAGQLAQSIVESITGITNFRIIVCGKMVCSFQK